jgi:hypothetical protein
LDFKQLDEENWRKIDPINRYLENLKVRRQREQMSSHTQSHNSFSLSQMSIGQLEHMSKRKQSQNLKYSWANPNSSNSSKFLRMSFKKGVTATNYSTTSSFHSITGFFQKKPT